jgi:PA14 domain-containing protein/von Willebrand factor type A domain-containing protein
MTELRFVGDLRIWYGIPLALIAGILIWKLYRRETRSRKDVLSWLLPTLRTLAVMLLILLLTEPILRHRWVVGQLARVLVFVDNSQSMSVTDENMSPDRKLIAAVNLGYLPDDLLPEDILAAQKALDRAQRRAEQLPASDAEKTNDTDLQTAVQLLTDLEEAHKHLKEIKIDEDLLPVATQKGALLYQYWEKVFGSEVKNLLQSKNYPQKPTGSKLLNQFEAPSNWNDNYGARLSGYLHPPATGEYTFWISSDDGSELYLSSNDNPNNKKRIARVTGYVPKRQWQQTPEQKSQKIRLLAGQKYYLEALHQEGSGEDHLAVGWQLPDGKTERPIPSSRLSCLPPGAKNYQRITGQDAMALFQRELIEPTRTVSKNKNQDRKQFAEKLSALSLKAGDWHQRLRLYFERWAHKLSLSNQEQVQQALQHFEGLSRYQRIQALLLEGDHPLLAQLAENHNVELVAFDHTEAQSLWRGRAGELNIAGRLLTFLPGNAEGVATNLSLSLDSANNEAQALSRTDDDENSNRVAAVLFTDGRHNHGNSPLQLAKELGAKEIPVFTVGFGSTRKIEDLAVIRTEHPSAVFHKDRIKGRIVLKDDMQPDRPFTLQITCDEKVLWKKELKTDASHRRIIDYDFPIEKFLQEKAAGTPRDLSYKSIPLNLNVEIAGLEPFDAESANDQKSFRLRANFQKNKILLLAGRPRWEFRYVHNLFERDEKWEITALIYDPTKPDGGIVRGDKPTQFPADRETLYTYDLIVLGDFQPAILKQKEWLWIRDAVLLRGTGLILIDGRRKHLREYIDSPIGEIIPVKWTNDEAIKNITTMKLTEKGKLRLTELGRDVAALSLATGSLNNDEVWNSLKPPHWLSAIEPLPGAEVFLEAIVEEQNVPAIVFRRFGAGKVFFAAFDESWRWRYRVADEYHGKYWNQTAALIMAPQFAVSDRFVSLDTGKLIYAPKQKAAIRARIRDDEGKPVFKGLVVHANLYLDDTKVKSIPLVGDEQSGDFTGATDELKVGNYQVRIQVLGYPEDQMIATAQFYVQPPEAGEMTELTCDETLLRQIASHSGGDYIREEDSASLADRLKPLSQGRVVETETVLLRSWWWFAAVLLLLTLEWLLRKRAGLL